MDAPESVAVLTFRPPVRRRPDGVRHRAVCGCARMLAEHHAALGGRLRLRARAARRRFHLHALALDDLVLRLRLLERAERKLLLLLLDGRLGGRLRRGDVVVVRRRDPVPAGALGRRRPAARGRGGPAPAVLPAARGRRGGAGGPAAARAAARAAAAGGGGRCRAAGAAPGVPLPPTRYQAPLPLAPGAATSESAPAPSSEKPAASVLPVIAPAPAGAILAAASARSEVVPAAPITR